MPEYGYKCEDCSNGGYYEYRMSEVPSKRECEKCGGVMKRRFDLRDIQINIPFDFHDEDYNYDKRPSGRKSHVIKDNPVGKR